MLFDRGGSRLISRSAYCSRSPAKKRKHSTNEITMISYLIGESERPWPTSNLFPPRLRHRTTLGDKEPSWRRPTVTCTMWVRAESQKLMESVLGRTFFFFIFFFLWRCSTWGQVPAKAVRERGALKNKQLITGRLKTSWSLSTIKLSQGWVHIQRQKAFNTVVWWWKVSVNL